ncbi:MAG: hypothetical protein AAGD25_41415 [Cyanobacteria bacterium P01_F01_bin.150]
MDSTDWEPGITTIYAYVGPKDISQALTMRAYRVCVKSSADVLDWVDKSQQELDTSSSFTATFIVDVAGDLWISDRL